MPPGGGGLGDSLILSIQTGKTLRKVEPVAKKPDPQNDFLNAIRQGKTLRKVEQPAPNAAPQKEASASNLGAFGGSAISDILARRKYLQNDDSEDSDEEDDDW